MFLLTWTACLVLFRSLNPLVCSLIPGGAFCKASIGECNNNHRLKLQYSRISIRKDEDEYTITNHQSAGPIVHLTYLLLLKKSSQSPSYVHATNNFRLCGEMGN